MPHPLQASPLISNNLLPISHRGSYSGASIAPFDSISSPINCDCRDLPISLMNRLKKTDGRRGKSAPRTRPPSAPSVHAAGTCGPVAGSAGIHAQAGGIGVPQDASVLRTSVSSVGGWWSASSPAGLYPPGGFSNFLHSYPFANHPNGNENFHFVGAGMSQSTVPPIERGATRTPSPAQQPHDTVDDIVDDLDAQEDETINVDDDCRTEKRLNWKVPDDIRLAFAWLRCSKDPVDGNDKKTDAYFLVQSYTADGISYIRLVILLRCRGGSHGSIPQLISFVCVA